MRSRRISRYVAARTGGNLLRRGEHATLIRSLLPCQRCIERILNEKERFARARERTATRSDGFLKNFRPGPPRPAFPFGAKAAERTEGRSCVEKEQHARVFFLYSLCRSPLAGRRSARTLGRAARLIEGPKPSRPLWKEKRSVCERKQKRLP